MHHKKEMSKNKKVKLLHRYYNEYGIKCSAYLIINYLFSKITVSNKLNNKAIRDKNTAILDYLSRYYKRCNKTQYISSKNKYKNCIWTAWLQGEDNAPEVIRLTIASKYKCANGHDVIVLTNENIGNYISVPEPIQIKYNNGKLGNAHYSDIVRMMILAKYGGVWLDATMLLHEPLDEKAFSSSFYSIGFNKEYSKYISNNRWIVSIIGGNSNSKYLKLISIMLNSYWIEHEVPIDYFVFDYLIALIYENDDTFKQIVNSLPKMTYYSNDISSIINEKYDKETFSKYMLENHIYRLTYKQNYIKYNSNQEITNYGYLFNTMLEDKL